MKLPLHQLCHHQHPHRDYQYLSRCALVSPPPFKSYISSGDSIHMSKERERTRCWLTQAWDDGSLCWSCTTLVVQRLMWLLLCPWQLVVVKVLCSEVQKETMQCASICLQKGIANQLGIPLLIKVSWAGGRDS